MRNSLLPLFSCYVILGDFLAAGGIGRLLCSLTEERRKHARSVVARSVREGGGVSLSLSPLCTSEPEALVFRDASIKVALQELWRDHRFPPPHDARGQKWHSFHFLLSLSFPRRGREAAWLIFRTRSSAMRGRLLTPLVGDDNHGRMLLVLGNSLGNSLCACLLHRVGENFFSPPSFFSCSSSFLPGREEEDLGMSSRVPPSPFP